MQDTRTIEKLELERRYWLQKSVPWMLITEKDIPNIAFQNISWLFPAQREELDAETMQERVAMYAHHKTLIDIAKQLDAAYALPAGQSLLEIRQLLARRCFLFDIFIPYIALKARDLRAENMNTYTEALRFSNQ